MLKKKTVTVGDEEFAVSEIAMRAMLPILPRLQGEPEDAQEAQIDMMKLGVFKDGKPMNDAVLDLSMSAYMELAMQVMQMNGVVATAEEAGKDSTPTKKPPTP